jgi:mannose-1-phosphate guanylyltransferase
MEKADNVVVKQASFQWNDLGTLGALYEITMKDFHENAISSPGKIQLDESDRNLIFCDDETEIRLEKIENCAVIKSGKSLLITSKW